MAARKMYFLGNQPALAQSASPWLLPQSQQTAVPADADPKLDAFWKVNVESQPCHLDLASIARLG